MTFYECPRCGKNLVTEEEPPGIIHKCDDCVERLVRVDDERNVRSLHTDTDRFCGCKVTTTSAKMGEPVRVVCLECGGVVR